MPEFFGVTASLYVAAATCTVWPATAFAAAALMVQKGVPCDPAPAFEHEELAPLTYSVVGVTARAAVAGSVAATIALSMTIPRPSTRAPTHYPPLCPIGPLRRESGRFFRQWQTVVGGRTPVKGLGPESGDFLAELQ